MQPDLLDFLIKTGLVWFFALSLFFPIGMFFMLLAAKHFLLKGAGAFITTLSTKWMDDSIKRTEAELKLESSLEKLTDQIEQIVAGSWDNRRYLDEKFDGLEEGQKTTLAKIETVIALIPKRKGDL